MRVWVWVVLVPVVLFGRVGGPDEYGYVFRDDDSGVPFEWIDETGADTLPLVGDDGYMPLELPFPFRFYGNEYEMVYVSTNGLVAVSADGADAYMWTHIPSTGLPNGFLAPLWTDGAFIRDTSAILYKTVGSAPSRKFVIIFYRQVVPYYASGEFPFTYEVIIEETAFGDNPVIFQYLNVYEPTHLDRSFGRGAAIGIESPDGTIGLEYSYDTTAVDSGRAIRFEVLPPMEHDVAITRVILPSAILANMPFSVEVKVRNMGSNFEDNVPIVLGIIDSMGNSLYSDSQMVSLPMYDSTRVEFGGIRLSYVGNITVRAESRLSTDELPDNNVFIVRANVFRHTTTRGGPDPAGYRWIDSFDPDGPSFTPISIDGSTMVLSGDDSLTSVSLPFAFNFYGAYYNTIYISSNGFISFLPISESFYSNDSIPNVSVPNAIIAPFWDDMNLNRTLDSTSGVYTKYTPSDSSFHIIWHNAFIPWHSTTDNVTFELVLRQDNSFLFNYERTETPTNESVSLGRSATVGIEDPTGTIGLLYEYNGTPLGNFLFPRFAIYFYREAGYVDTIPPTIAHIPPTRAYSSLPAVILYADIIDLSGIATDSLYYSIGGRYNAITHDSVVGTTYFYSFPMPSAGVTVRYYFVAYDASEGRNRTRFPSDSTFSFPVYDPHNGGPDSVGYRFIDSFSDSAGAPSFEWVELDPDLGGRGVVIPIVGDDVISAPIYIGGRFNFYGTRFDSVKVCTNGWLTFYTDEDTAWYRVSIPDVARPNATIVPWGMDLIATPSSKILYFSDTVNRRFIVEWKDVVAYARRDSAITFEVILDYGRTGSYVKIQYLKIENTIPLGLIGIENLTGTDGLVYYAFGEPAGVGIPSDSLAILFFNPTVGIGEDELVPERLSLVGPVPNPFNSSATFEVAMPDAGQVKIVIYNYLGQNIRTLFNGTLKRGYHKIQWDGKTQDGLNLPSGLYFVVLQHDNLRIVNKALLLK